MALATLGEIIESDFNELYDDGEAAVSVTYTVKETDTASVINVFASFDSDLAATQSGLAAFMTFNVRKSDVARPAKYDTILYAGNIYQVNQIIGGNKHSWTLSASSDLRQIPNNMR